MSLRLLQVKAFLQAERPSAARRASTIDCLVRADVLSPEDADALAAYLKKLGAGEGEAGDDGEQDAAAREELRQTETRRGGG